MIRGIYTSASGMVAGQIHTDVIANNLANTATTGYKKDTVVFRSFPEVLLQRVSGREQTRQVIGSTSPAVFADAVQPSFQPGPLKETNQELDLAVVGNGFFVVATPQGERYTRNGSFRLDAAGRLVTADGFAVLGEQGEIVLPPGQIVVSKEGIVTVDDQAIARLQLVDFPDRLTLQKEGNALFSATARPEQVNGEIAQGFLETSGVNPVQEMVSMITTMRAYEANQKVIQTLDGTLDKSVNDIGRI